MENGDQSGEIQRSKVGGRRGKEMSVIARECQMLKQGSMHTGHAVPTLGPTAFVETILTQT